MNLISFELLRNLPLVPSKLFDFQPSLSHRTSPKSQLDPTIQTKLFSKFPEEVIEALQIIIAVFIEGNNVELLPKIISLLPHENEQVKRLSQYLVVELSKVTEDKSPLILSISSLHKEVLHSKSIHRGNAIKTLSSIMLNSPDLLHVLVPTLNKMVLDKNAYVRKTCALAWLKMASSGIDEDDFDREQILSLLKKHLFKDIPYVLGTALVVYQEISNDNNYEFLHSTYRRICRDILRFNSFDRALVLEMLHKYTFLYLSDIKSEKRNKLYMDEDLAALCNALEKIAMTQDFASIVQASKIALFLEDETLLRKYINALFKFLNKNSEIKYQILLAIEQYAIKYPKLVAPHYKKLYVYHIEKMYCKLIKIRILNKITEDWNFNDIFDELCNYVHYHSKELIISTLNSIGTLALKCPKYSLKCIKYLMNHVLGKNAFLASKSIISLSEYLQNMDKEKIPILAFCVNNLTQVAFEDAKLKLINLLIQNIHLFDTLGLKIFHKLALQFKSSSFMLKLRTVELGYALLSKHKGLGIFDKALTLVLEFGCFDENIMLRDFSKFIKKSLDNNSVEIADNIRNCLQTAQNVNDKQNSSTLGSLTYLAGYKVKGFRDFPRQEDIVHESTADLRQETEIKPTPTHRKETLCFQSEVTEQSAVITQNTHEEPVVRQHHNIVYEKDLATINDDFFDEP